jgi:hypothetical protein
MPIWRTGALTVLLVSGFVTSDANACGTERWAVKTLSDAGVGAINRMSKSATVPELRALDAPSQASLRHDGDTRFGPVEINTYRVKALLLGYRLEDDEDFHLVLADPNDPAKTMIAEIPASDCVGDAAFGAKLQKMRDTLVARFGSPGVHTKRLPHPVQVTIRGVGFFDITHSTPQDGVAPNDIELHPVLGISLSTR